MICQPFYRLSAAKLMCGLIVVGLMGNGILFGEDRASETCFVELIDPGDAQWQALKEHGTKVRVLFLLAMNDPGSIQEEDLKNLASLTELQTLSLGTSKITDQSFESLVQ